MAKKANQVTLTGGEEVRADEDGQPLRCDNPEKTSGSPAEQGPPIALQRARKPMPRTDPELQAMARIDRILADLDGNQQRRVVEWIRDRFGPQCRFGPFEGGTPNDHDGVKESIR
jgi:hypothetical protein